MAVPSNSSVYISTFFAFKNWPNELLFSPVVISVEQLQISRIQQPRCVSRIKVIILERSLKFGLQLLLKKFGDVAKICQQHLDAADEIQVLFVELK